MPSILTFRKGQSGASNVVESREKALRYAEHTKPLVTGREGEFFKVGVFFVSQGTKVFALNFSAALRRNIQAFISHYQQQDWELSGKVLVRRVPVIADDLALIQHGITESNPLREPDQDMYEVIAPFKQAPRPGRLLVSDETALHLPPGWRLCD